jgi:serine/threonine protein kinase
MSERSNDRVGEHIGRYRLIRLLGTGGYADVYLGEHRLHNTQVAIKLFHRNTSEVDLEEVINEARTIAQLEHPHIIRVFECSVDNDYPFLVMGYAPNGTLRQRHPRGSRLSCVQVVSYVQQIAEALQYAHDHKLVHRDVKPENMLIDEHGQILLSDFGLVTFTRSSGNQTTGDMRGTVTYMAPEQLHGKPRTASDQYSLGIVAYEWLSGKRPFNGSFAEIASQHILASPPSLCLQLPDLPPAVEQVVFTALAKHPSDRFKNVTLFAQALHQASLSPITTRPSSMPGKPLATQALISPTDNDYLTPSSGKNSSNPSRSAPVYKAETPRRLEDQPTQLNPQDLWSYEDSAPHPTSTILAEQPTQLNAQPAATAKIDTNRPAEPGAPHIPTPTRSRILKAVAVLLGLLLLIGGSLALINGIPAPSSSSSKQPAATSGIATTIVHTPTSTNSTKVAGSNTPVSTTGVTSTPQTTPTLQATPTQGTTPTPTHQATATPKPTPTPTPKPLLPPLPTIIGGLLP